MAAVSAIGGAMSAGIPVLINSRAERAKHVAELGEARRRQESELAEARRRQESELAEARRRHEVEVAEARRRHEAEVDDARRKEARLEDRERRLEEMLTKSQERMSELLAASIRNGGAEDNRQQRDQIIDDFGLSVDDEPEFDPKETDSPGATMEVGNLEVANTTSNSPGAIEKERGSYVLWLAPTKTEEPRYVHFSWGGSGGPYSFKIRDYLGGRLYQHQGATIQQEVGFEVSECDLTRDEVWAKARCHTPARGELFHTVEDYPWWLEKLRLMTQGRMQDLGVEKILDRQDDDRNLLLMLSDTQQPHPRDEIAWHASHCISNESTYLITPRMPTGLSPEKSIVAFYGNIELHYRLLGFGVFLGNVRLDSEEGRKILKEHPLYSTKGVPDNSSVFIHLRDVVQAPEGACLDSFKGTIVGEGTSNGLPLALPYIPTKSPAGVRVYFKNAK